MDGETSWEGQGFTVAIFVVCFTPAPFSVLDLVAQP